MIRKGQVLHGEGITGRWQVRHCQKREEFQTIMHSWWSPASCYPELLFDEIVGFFLLRSMGSKDAVLFLKIYPSMSKEGLAQRLSRLAVMGCQLSFVAGVIHM